MDIVSIITFLFAVLIVLYTFGVEIYGCRRRLTADSLSSDSHEPLKTFDLSGLFAIIKKYHWIIWGILLLLAVFFRIWQLGDIPGGLHQDSAMSAVDAKALLEYGTDRFGMRYPVHFTAWISGQQSAMMNYLLVLVFALFGVSEVTMVIPSLTISILGMIAFYLLVRELQGELPALLAFLVICFNPWHFLQSRWALDANIFPHFLIIALFLLIKGLSKHKYIYISMVFFGLSHYCYGVSLYTVPVFLLFFSFYLLYKKVVTVKTVLISILIYIIISLPFFLTMFFTVFKLPGITTSFFTIPSFAESTRGGDILFFTSDPWQEFKSNARSLFSVVVMQKTGDLWNTAPTFGTVYRCMIPFSFLGIYHLAKQIRIGKKSNPDRVTAPVMTAKYVGLAIYGFVAFGSGFVTMIVNTWRINIFHYMHIFLVLMGIYYVGKKHRRLFVLTLSLLIGMNTLFLTTYFTSYAQSWSESDSYSYHLKNALNYIADKECDVYYITDDTLFEDSAAVSEIDTIFLHNLDSLYLQGKTNQSEGREYRPYQEQYQYINAGELERIEPDKKAIYLINYYDKELFAEEFFREEKFGPFYVEIPLSMGGE